MWCEDYDSTNTTRQNQMHHWKFKSKGNAKDGVFFLCSGASIMSSKWYWPSSLIALSPHSPLPSLTSPDIETKLSFCSGWQETAGNNAFSLWKRFFPAMSRGMSIPVLSVIHSSSASVAHHLPSRYKLYIGKTEGNEFGLSTWSYSKLTQGHSLRDCAFK